MTKLLWDKSGERFFETGIDRGVIYPNNGDGIAWNGLISVNENPSGGEARPFYLDGYKYQNRSSPTEWAGNIEAYTYPEAFENCVGTKTIGNGLYMGMQKSMPFGFTYRTRIGNDLIGDTVGYKIHMVYNVLAVPSSKNYQSVGENPEIMAFNWNVTSKPVKIAGYKPTPYMVVDTRKITAPLLASLETILYGTDSVAARLPSPTELVALFIGWPTLFVTDNGDGTFTISGPDSIVRILDPYTYQLSGDTIVDNGNGTFSATSF